MTFKFVTDQTTCECKPIVSTCSAMGTTGGILGENGKFLNVEKSLLSSAFLHMSNKVFDPNIH